MSPRTSTLLALIGILLAGIPLPVLTGARREQPTATPAAQQPPLRERRTVCATLQCSGQPTELRLLHEGLELARLSAEELALTPTELELQLPAASHIDIELEAHWPEGTPPQAASLTLEPGGLPARRDTQWTGPASNTLHSLYSFTW